MSQSLIEAEFNFSPLHEKENEKELERLLKLLGCVETIESVFCIEFSCGDGKWLSELETCEENEKYDGKVCLISPALDTLTGWTLKGKLKLEIIQKDGDEYEGACYSKVDGKKRADFNLNVYGNRVHVTNFETK